MADEKDTTPNNDAQDSVGVAIDTPKKQRKSRTKKVALELASVEVAADPAVGKRGKQTRAPKSKEIASSTKSAPVKSALKTVQAATAAPAAAIDEMADLLQLEEENQTLRRLLAEKLRAENTDLRKRLNLA